MREVALHHVIERNAVALVVEPVVRAFGGVDGSDEVADMAVVVLQQLHQCLPLFVLIVLQLQPQVVVLRVVGEDEHAHLGVRHGVPATRRVLQAHEALVVVGGRVDEVPDEHLDGAVLSVAGLAHLILAEAEQERYLLRHQLLNLVDDVLVGIHGYSGLKEEISIRLPSGSAT